MNAELIPVGGVVADIGCDHAKLSIYLIEKKIATKVIAMDVAEGPLMRARDNVARCGMNEHIECRLSDGAKELRLLSGGKAEADYIVMAGIGGRLAIKIVDDSIDIFKALKCFIIQAQSELDVLRGWLVGNGFYIVDEDMVYEDGKYYTAMKLTTVSCNDAGHVRNDIDESGLMYGPRLIEKKHPVLLDYLKYEENKYEGLLVTVPEDKADDVCGRLTVIKDALNNFTDYNHRRTT